MRIKLVGINERDYTSKKTGQNVHATDLHCIRTSPGPEEMRGNPVLVITASEFPKVKKMEIDAEYTVEVDTYVQDSGRFYRLTYVEGL